jgi:hypothetical protein
VVAETLRQSGSGHDFITSRTTVDFPAPEGPEMTTNRLVAVSFIKLPPIVGLTLRVRRHHAERDGNYGPHSTF